ncbi:MAG TPA: hypothetical protein VIL58_02575, partial [Thermoplasmata archaeon]
KTARAVNQGDHGGGRGRLGILAMRESLFIGVAAIGSWLFLNHGILYLDRAYQLRPVPATAYLFATGVLYFFLRATTLIAFVRAPAYQDGVEICPECGQPIDDNTPTGALARHEQIHVPFLRPRVPAPSALRSSVERSQPLPPPSDLDAFVWESDEFENLPPTGFDDDPPPPDPPPPPKPGERDPWRIR